MDKDAVPTISIDGSKNSDDVISDIQSSFRESRILKNVSKELQTFVIKTLTERANGIFLWVDLMMRFSKKFNYTLRISDINLEKSNIVIFK